jgi:hypothetical protein
MSSRERNRTLDRRLLPPLARLPTLVTLIAGLWLVAAPFVLEYGDAATWVDGYWNDVLVGAAIAVVSATRIVTPLFTAPLSLATAGLGIWLIVAPFALGYNVDGESSAATANDITTGIVVLVFAVASWLVGSWVNLRQSRDQQL